MKPVQEFPRATIPLALAAWLAIIVADAALGKAEAFGLRLLDLALTTVGGVAFAVAGGALVVPRLQWRAYRRSSGPQAAAALEQLMSGIAEVAAVAVAISGPLLSSARDKLQFLDTEVAIRERHVDRDRWDAVRGCVFEFERRLASQFKPMRRLEQQSRDESPDVVADTLQRLAPEDVQVQWRRVIHRAVVLGKDLVTAAQRTSEAAEALAGYARNNAQAAGLTGPVATLTGYAQTIAGVRMPDGVPVAPTEVDARVACELYDAARTTATALGRLLDYVERALDASAEIARDESRLARISLLPVHGCDTFVETLNTALRALEERGPSARTAALDERST
jgi:hypothetical protein